MDRIKRIQELVVECNTHCNAYYNNDNPIISDREYDMLYNELESLERSEKYVLSNSPTQRAGYEVV